ncbi:MAG: response regulator [Candidatus Kryptoniota bacterium]
MAIVLIAEDQDEIQALLEFKLKNSGYDVVLAENGKKCIEVAQSNPPDLIVLDMMMPVMNGLDTLANLKKDPKLQAIPVIIVSAKSTEQDIVKALELGADDYVTKPFSPQVFIARVKAVLRRCQRS